MPPDPIDRFEERFKRWARRPPATPPHEASRRVLRRLAADANPPPFALRPWFAAAAAVLALVVMGRIFLPGPPPPVLPVEEEPVAGRVEAPPVPDGVVLMWLDAETPLYLTLNTPETPQGEPTP